MSRAPHFLNLNLSGGREPVSESLWVLDATFLVDLYLSK